MGEERKRNYSRITSYNVCYTKLLRQDISVAGKQKGFDGERSSLFFEVMRLLQETQEENRPKHLFIENVKNLFSVNRGLDFLEVLYS